MASYTENLNLLKKDPVADGADTFNITTMLNDNWDKIDAAKGQIDSALSNKADCVAPPEYKVATADSWDTGSAAVYQRTQENMVCVCGEFRAIQNKSVEDGALLGTIPEGFRPRRYILVPGSVQDGSDRLSCAVQFTASGNIIYNGKPNMSMSMFRIFINCTFFTN